ncbi:hypothetical protein ILUMI_01763 [Ignelater luminosus]|uniref:Retrovirus-related Pol polyprotein from transposon TNT 1-94-like beta-barrel domain-containing protein n=1 Tax=Ignelater luminosus TaxID=2038154 RepID=A0A8K0DJ04_IGNLU|nr:hypothetical protein ILUMI_01763 [Ignelater luminosus]
MIEKKINADEKVQALIISNINKTVLVHLMNYSTAGKMWSKLVTLYKQKSTLSGYMLQQQFCHYKFKGKGKGMDINLLGFNEETNILEIITGNNMNISILDNKGGQYNGNGGNGAESMEIIIMYKVVMVVVLASVALLHTQAAEDFMGAEDVHKAEFQTQLQWELNGEKIEGTIKNVLYVLNLRKNLLSVKKLEVAGMAVAFRNEVVEMFDTSRELISVGHRNVLYEIRFKPILTESLMVSKQSSDMEL